MDFKSGDFIYDTEDFGLYVLTERDTKLWIIPVATMKPATEAILKTPERYKKLSDAYTDSDKSFFAVVSRVWFAVSLLEERVKNVETEQKRGIISKMFKQPLLLLARFFSLLSSKLSKANA